MTHFLLNLITTPERALRLVAWCLDCYPDEVNFRIDSALEDAYFSGLNVPGNWATENSEQRFRYITVWLEGSAADSPLSGLITTEGGSLAASPEQADLLVAHPDDLPALEQRWPRRLVVPILELEAILGAEVLQPQRNTLRKAAELPKPLRAIWSRLRSGSVKQIRVALEDYSALLATVPELADVLLEEAGVDGSSGSLILGKRFGSNTGSAPHLLYGLLGLLSRAPLGSRGTKLRQAVRTLTAKCASLPELRGFEALQELRVEVSHTRDPDGPVSATLAECWGPLPALRSLTIESCSDQPITSLDGLCAPALREVDLVNLDLRSINSLAANTALERINLASNEQLSDLRPLASSLATLRALNVSSTAVHDLSLFAAGCQLQELDLDDCNALTSFKGLEGVVLCENHFSLSTLPQIRNLRHLPQLQEGELRLYELPLLESLEGIDSEAERITSMHFSDLKILNDLSALSALHRLEQLEIRDCPSLKSLEVLQDLPCLTTVDLKDCKALTRLPKVWPASLQSLRVEHCPITRLGTLPEGLTGNLDLRCCRKLKTLEGLEACTGLSILRIRPLFTDLSALAGLPQLNLEVDMREDGYALPDAFIDALAALPHCRLSIIHSEHYWGGFQLEQPQALARIPHLRALDLSECEIKDASAFMGLAELELLKVRPRSELSSALGGCTFDTPGKIAKLKLTLMTS